MLEINLLKSFWFVYVFFFDCMVSEWDLYLFLIEAFSSIVCMSLNLFVDLYMDEFLTIFSVFSVCFFAT